MIYGKSPLGTWSSLIFHSMSIGWILDRERDPRPHVIFDPLAITKWGDSAKTPTTLSGIFDFYTRAIHLWFAQLFTSIFVFLHFHQYAGTLSESQGKLRKWFKKKNTKIYISNIYRGHVWVVYASVWIRALCYEYVNTSVQHYDFALRADC